jgi:DNA-binding CsgD family transcriptional regulator
MAPTAAAHAKRGLVERDGELGVIAELLADASAGDGGALLITGVPGIGKTALLDRAAALASATGVRVLSARAGELEQELAFAVARQLFEPVLAELPAADLDDLFGGAARHARGPLGLDDSGGNPASESSALHGLSWLTSNLAERGPLLLAVDDLHWADEPSLRFLDYLARRVGDHPVLICAASRPELDRERDRLRAAIDGSWRRILTPSPLSGRGVREVVDQVLASDVDAEFSDACARASGGNPFLLIEALMELRSAGVRPTADQAHRLDDLQPEAVTRALLARVARLGEDATSTSRAVAVLGGDANLRRVASWCGLDVAAAGTAVGGLQRDGILSTGPDLEFAHPLIRTTVYADLAHPERGLGHLRAAELLDAEGADVDRVTSHLLRAEPSGSAWVTERLRTAATAALSTGAPESAAALLDRALGEPPPEDQRRDVLLDLARARQREGSMDEANDCFQRAVDLTTETETRIQLVREMAGCMLLSGRAHEVVEHLDAAIASARDDHPELATELELDVALAAHLVRPASEWAGRLAEAATRATSSTPAARSIRALHAYVAASVGTSDAASVAAVARSSLSSVAGENPPQLGQYAAAGLAMGGAYDEALAVLDGALDVAREFGDPALFGFVSLTRSWIAHRRGRLAEAEADAQAGLDAAAAGTPSVPYAVGTLVVALVDTGQLDRADALLTGHGMTGTLDLAVLPAGTLYLARGRLRLAQGRIIEALADEVAAREILLATGFGAPVFAEWRRDLAMARLASGDEPGAREVAEEDLHLSRQFAGPRELGMALTMLATIDGAGALDLLHEAVDVLEPSEATAELARTLVELGATLRRRGHRVDARALLLRGLDLASEHGAARVADRARQELTAAGARPRRERSSGRESLTAGELRVARLAAEGRSNREIAQALFVTRRTVEVHLTNTYRKLGIRSREHLPTALGPG